MTILFALYINREREREEGEREEEGDGKRLSPVLKMGMTAC